MSAEIQALESWNVAGDLLRALTLQAGYNTAIVCIGAGLLGAGAGAIGVFVLLRKRSLMSDAISHATLPGVAMAFILGTWLLGDGRQLPLLLAGAAISGAIGMLLVQWIIANTRLTEDVAIGTVLSTFFALGIVLLTVIQTMHSSGQAGLEGFLLGSAAAMLASEALTIAVSAALVLAIVLLLAKEFTALCFDAEFAESSGLPVARLDFLLIGLLLAVIVIGLTTVGLILIIALAIIPPVAARFWTERSSIMVLISAAIGGSGAFLGASISSLAPGLPTGGVIVLVLAAIFLLSLLFSPVRGIVAGLIRHWRFQRIVHERQGLLALARNEPIFDPLTRRLLTWRGLLAGNGTATLAGRAAAARMVRDQALWNQYRDSYPEQAHSLDTWSLLPIEQALPRDLVRELEARLSPAPVGPGPLAPPDGASASTGGIS